MVSSAKVVSMVTYFICPGEVKAYLNNRQARAIKSEHKFLIFGDILTCFEGETGSTIVKKVCQRDTGKVVIFQEAIRLLS